MSSINIKAIDAIPDDKIEQFLLTGDGDKDKVRGAKDTVSANQLKPSQNEIFFGKSLGMAVVGLLGIAPTVGGYLGSIWSKENYIMDGHHRWVATMLGDPSRDISGYKIDLNVRTLIPILRKAGAAFGKYSDHEEDKKGQLRPGNKGGDIKSDINIYTVTDKDVDDFIYKGKFTSSKFYKLENGIKFLKKIGNGDEEAGLVELKKRVKAVQKIKPPSDAPPRVLMPVIRGQNKIKFPVKVNADGEVMLSKVKVADEEALIVDLLNKGTVKVTSPITLERGKLLSFDKFVAIMEHNKKYVG